MWSMWSVWTKTLRQVTGLPPLWSFTAGAGSSPPGAGSRTTGAGPPGRFPSPFSRSVLTNKKQAMKGTFPGQQKRDEAQGPTPFPDPPPEERIGQGTKRKHTKAS